MIGGMGPLPPLHRLSIVGLVVLLSLATGVWLADYLALPVGGIGVGLAAGLMIGFLLVHDFRRTPAGRVTRRR